VTKPHITEMELQEILELRDKVSQSLGELTERMKTLDLVDIMGAFMTFHFIHSEDLMHQLQALRLKYLPPPEELHEDGS